MGIVTVGKPTVALMNSSQQLIILIIQNKAFISNQNMSGLIFHSFKFVLLKGITMFLSIRCFLLRLPPCNEDASTALKINMFCTLYRSSIFSSTSIIGLFSLLSRRSCYLLKHWPQTRGQDRSPALTRSEPTPSLHRMTDINLLLPSTPFQG